MSCTRDFIPVKYEVGRYSYGVPKIRDYGEFGALKIGAFCSFAPDVFILIGGNHRINWVSTYPFTAADKKWDYYPNKSFSFGKGDIIIGNDVWMGTNATILSGITIGDGAVIGAFAVVTKNVPPYAVAVGNPAEVKKYRFSEDIIKELLEIKWWDWDDEKIKKYLPLICSDKIEEFIKAVKEERNKVKEE